MQLLRVTLFWLVFTLPIFCQTDRGTITGTVSDPTGAVIPNAALTAVHSATGSQYRTVTTPTGNYTIASLPPGVYEVIVEVPGFKKFTQEGIRVQVATTARIDVILQIGSSAETVNVTADAPLLRTDNAEQSTTISRDTLNALPLNFATAQGGAIRNPLSFVNLAPGTYMAPVALDGGANRIRVNGMPQSTFKVMVEGQDSGSSLSHATYNHSAPSMDSVEEYTLQSSNFAAEFGQVGGGLFNFAAKSGTNQFHGSAYEFLVNEALNGGMPFTNDGSGNLIRPRARKHDLGANIGGPIRRDKTFFFFNIESYIDRKISSGTYATVPTEAMRNGDFGAILTPKILNTDPLGRSIIENTIYDPLSNRVVNGRVVRDPFQANTVPKSSFDPVAAKIQALLPAPTRPGLVNNWEQIFSQSRTQIIRSIKVDHNIGGSSKVSFYWQWYTSHEYSGWDGLPVPITSVRDKQVYSHTLRLNFDHTVTPTLLLHLGIGEQRFHNPDTSPPSVLENYDAVKQLGLAGGAVNGFPRIAGLQSSYGGFGGTSSNVLGPINANKYYTDKPTATATLTWVRDSHTYKAGGDWRVDGFTDRNVRGSTGIYNFSALQTGLPSTEGQNLSGGTVGFPYASFLLGVVGSASINTPQDPQLRKRSMSLFAQDTWKVSRKLTLDYGVRYDRQGQGREIYNRMGAFGPYVPNPSAGGLPGAMMYEGFGPGRCNCYFSRTYPYGFGPRLGIAYQIDSKTVLRAGWGLGYNSTADIGYITNTAIVGAGYNQLVFNSPSYGDPSGILRNGLQYNRADLFKVVFDAGARPSPGQIDSPPYWIDPNAGRPSRSNMWSISLQREITRNFVIEAAYVGNRSVWNTANSLMDWNALAPGRIRSFGLDVNNAADRTLLTSRLNSSTAQSRGFKAPYIGFPDTLTVAQSLRPYPQYGNISAQYAPLGTSWYDSLQMKATKRYSHGLDLTAAFTWQKELSLGSDGGGVNDVYNRPQQKSISPLSMPFVFVSGINYQLPAWNQDRLTRALTVGWVITGMMRYSSGLPISVPAAQNALSGLLFRSTYANRVPGEPLFLKDLNCHCIDPNKDFVLNPNAWSDPAAGQWGTSAARYSDYRYARRPDEQLGLTKTFRIREGMSLSVRAEFFNVFNRTQLNNPDSTNAKATQSLSNGVVVSGFGRINSGSVYAPPRNGQVVVRFNW